MDTSTYEYLLSRSVFYQVLNAVSDGVFIRRKYLVMEKSHLILKG